jgi:hypothetical protein
MPEKKEIKEREVTDCCAGSLPTLFKSLSKFCSSLSCFALRDSHFA